MGRVNVHGQVTIPKKIRESFSIHPDDVVTFAIKNGDIVLVPDDQKEYTLESLHELLGTPSVHLSDEELAQACGDAFVTDIE